MKCETKILGNMAVFMLEGKLICSALNELHELIDNKIHKEGVKYYSMNLEKVKIMDSAGIGFLISISRRLAAKGNSFCLINPPKPLLQSLEVVGVSRIVPIYCSEEEAVRASES